MADREGDPHSPWRYGTGPVAQAIGLPTLLGRLITWSCAGATSDRTHHDIAPSKEKSP